MPISRFRNMLVAVLSLSLLASLPGVAAAVAAEDVTSPPSLEMALSVLLPVSAAASAASTTGEGASIETAKVRLPECGIADIPTRYSKVKYWKKTLLDTNLKLPKSYKPWDLVSVKRAGIAGSGKVRKIMIDDLRALAKAARKAGKPLAVRSTFRSYAYQKSLFNHYKNTYGYSHAIKFSARAGHSEHQLGTTIDFTTAPGVPLTTKFGDSPAGKWLARNGWKYGFIMSYPKGKKSASCYGYEPWHWRYFGRTLARKIHESGQVPRRYLYENFEIAP